jgi:hypothetical protein
MKWEGSSYGPWWLGLLKIRCYVNDSDYKTFWHLSVWKFTLGISFPTGKAAKP